MGQNTCKAKQRRQGFEPPRVKLDLTEMPAIPERTKGVMAEEDHEKIKAVMTTLGSWVPWPAQSLPSGHAVREPTRNDARPKRRGMPFRCGLESPPTFRRMDSGATRRPRRSHGRCA